MVAAIGDGAAFHKGREFAAWLGLIPKQYSTGGKTKLLGITKRGNPYLRKMFIHGARAAVLRLNRERSPMGAWNKSFGGQGPTQRGGRRHGAQARADHLGWMVAGTDI